MRFPACFFRLPPFRPNRITGNVFISDAPPDIIKQEPDTSVWTYPALFNFVLKHQAITFLVVRKPTSSEGGRTPLPDRSIESDPDIHSWFLSPTFLAFLQIS